MSDPVYRSTWCNVLSALHMPVIWKMKQRTCPCPQYSVNSVFFPRLQIRVRLFKFYNSLILSYKEEEKAFFLSLKDQNYVHEFMVYENLHHGMKERNNPVPNALW